MQSQSIPWKAESVRPTSYVPGAFRGVASHTPGGQGRSLWSSESMAYILSNALCVERCLRVQLAMSVYPLARVRQGTRLAALLPQDILETFRDKSTPGPRGKEVTKAAFDEGMQVNGVFSNTRERTPMRNAFDSCLSWVIRLLFSCTCEGSALARPPAD